MLKTENFDLDEESQCVVDLQDRTLSKLRQMLESCVGSPNSSAREIAPLPLKTQSSFKSAMARAVSSLSRAGSSKSRASVPIKGGASADDLTYSPEISPKSAILFEQLLLPQQPVGALPSSSSPPQQTLPSDKRVEAVSFDAQPQEDSQALLDEPQLELPAVTRTPPSSIGLQRRSHGLLSPTLAQAKRLLHPFSSMPTLMRKPSEIVPSHLKVFIVTWNIGSAMPLEAELAHWIPPCALQSHVIAIGVQESAFKASKDSKDIKDKKQDGGAQGLTRQGSIQVEKLGRHSSTHALNKMLNNKVLGRAKRHDEFDALIKAHVGEGYSPIRCSRLGAIRLLVFVRSDLRSQVANVCKTSKATGIGGVIGNKGGVALKLTMAGTELCFISCHLAAHEDKVNRRNQDLQDIFKATSETLDSFNADITNKYHHTFVFGDLNYRIDVDNVPQLEQQLQQQQQQHYQHHDPALRGGSSEDVSVEVDVLAMDVPSSQDLSLPLPSANPAWHGIIRMIENNELQRLFEGDQLMCEMKANRVLQGFNETRPSFLPTFKCQRGRVDMAYNSQRTPSYCDRILWSSLPGCARHVVQTTYASCPQVTTSDHKPVYGVFEIELPMRDAERFSTVLPSFRARKAFAPEIKFSRLKVLNLKDSCRPADVIVRFWGSILHTEKTAPAREPGDDEPNFLTDMIVDPPVLTLNTMGKALLGTHIFIGIWDKSKKPLKMIGQSVLNLDDWVSNHSPQTCLMPLLRFGVQVGELSGTMTLRDPSAQFANISPSFAYRLKDGGRRPSPK